MYILEKNGTKKIDVYELTPNPIKFVDYKMDNIEQIPQSEMVYGIISNIKNGVIDENTNLNYMGKEKPFDVRMKDINFINDTLFGAQYHILEKYYNAENDKEAIKKHVSKVIKKYVRDLNSNGQLMRVFDYNKEEKEIETPHHFLLTKGLYRIINQSFPYRIQISDMIDLPKTLYLLELLNQGYFSHIDENVKEQISLFDVTNSYSLDYDILNKLDEQGITQNAWEKAERQAEESAKIKKYIK